MMENNWNYWVKMLNKYGLLGIVCIRLFLNIFKQEKMFVYVCFTLLITITLLYCCCGWCTGRKKNCE